MDILPATFSGSWYPASADECEREIKSFLRQEKGNGPKEKKIVGGIVPHAGWYFSGAIACRVIREMAREEDMPDAVVIFGMHLPPGAPFYLLEKGGWETPFGPVMIHEELAAALGTGFSVEKNAARAFSRDNTIELQLPFVRYFFPKAAIVPVGAPPQKASLEMARKLVDLSREMGISIKVIGSTDLTHYGDNYGFSIHGRGKKGLDWVTTVNDRRIISAMEEMDGEKVIQRALAEKNACCGGAAAAAIEAAKGLGAHGAVTFDYATSYDRHPSDSFVGYVGMVFEKTDS